MGSLKKSLKSLMKSPFRLVSSVAKGDISGAIGGAASAASLGTIGSGKQAKLQNTQTAQAAQEQAKKAYALEKQEEQRRKTIFYTSGKELGEMIGTTNLKRRGSILGN